MALQGLNVIDRNRDHLLVRNGERCGSKLWFLDFSCKTQTSEFWFHLHSIILGVSQITFSVILP